MNKKFDGVGFDKSPIEGDEAGKVRHIIHEIEDNWEFIAGGANLQKGVKVLGAIVKIGVPIGSLMLAVGIYFASQGWVGQ